MTNSCAVCGVEASLKCAGCYNVTYCSKEHQVEDWKKIHRDQCTCYKIQCNQQFGRYCIAGRDIKKGEIILKESPMVIGPKMLTAPVCLGCMKTLSPPEDKTDYYKCKGCQWPMCNESCEKSIWHKEECRIFQKANYYSDIRYTPSEKDKRYSCYSVILPMRILLFRGTNAKLYNKILTFESHLEQRRGTSLYGILRQNLVRFITMLLGPTFGDAEEILTIAGILDTNTFNIRVPDNSVCTRGLYYEAAMFSHDCTPNVRHMFRADKKLIMFATRDIKKGEIISVTYAQPLKGTVKRRTDLLEGKCFLCSCARCKDPTEFGLYLNALICPKCSTGRLVQLDTTEIQSEYKCDKCDEEYCDREVVELREMFADKIKETPRTVADFHYLLAMSKRLGHNTCAEILEIKYALVQLYGDGKHISSKNVNRKTDLCLQLLEVANVLDTPLGSFRTNILKELSPCLKREVKLNPGLAHSDKYEDLINEAEYVQQFEENILKLD